MTFFSNLFKTILFLSFLALIGWGMYVGYIYFEQQLVVLSSEHRANLMFIALICFVCSCIIGWAIYAGTSKMSSTVSIERKVTYDMFLQFWMNKERLLNDKDKYREEQQKLNQHMLLWASEKTLRAFTKWNSLKNEENENKETIKVYGEKVVLLIRKEINKDTVPFKYSEIGSLLIQ